MRKFVIVYCQGWYFYLDITRYLNCYLFMSIIGLKCCNEKCEDMRWAFNHMLAIYSAELQVLWVGIFHIFYDLLWCAQLFYLESDLSRDFYHCFVINLWQSNGSQFMFCLHRQAWKGLWYFVFSESWTGNRVVNVTKLKI